VELSCRAPSRTATRSTFVERITCPVFATVGMMDATCPPPTVLAMFDRIPTTKQILVEPHLTHDWWRGIRPRMAEWLAHYLR